MARDYDIEDLWQDVAVLTYLQRCRTRCLLDHIDDLSHLGRPENEEHWQRYEALIEQLRSCVERVDDLADEVQEKVGG